MHRMQYRNVWRGHCANKGTWNRPHSCLRRLVGTQGVCRNAFMLARFFCSIDTRMAKCSVRGKMPTELTDPELMGHHFPFTALMFTCHHGSNAVGGWTRWFFKYAKYVCNDCIMLGTWKQDMHLESCEAGATHPRKVCCALCMLLACRLL